MKLAFWIIHLSFIAVSSSDRIIKEAPAPPAPGCKEGETVVQLNAYKYKCIGGQRELVSCVGGPRVGNVEVPVNKTTTVDGFWYRCDDQGGRPAFIEEFRCAAGDKVIHARENVTIGNLVFYCDPMKGIQAIGCVFNSPNGEVVEAEVGETVQVGDSQQYCHGLYSSKAASGSGPSISNTSDVACIHDGKQRQPKEEWTSKRFKYICKPGGQVDIIACVIDKDNTVPVGQSSVNFGLLHRCYKEGDRVSYKSEICGVGGAKCGEDGSVPSAASQAGPNVNGQQPNDKPGPSVDQNDGAGNASANASEARCVKDGQSHKAGETWVNSNFKYTCHSDGAATITACVTDSDKEIQLGEVWVLSGHQHVCSPAPSGASYNSQLCGAQVKCGPEGLQRSTGQ